MIVTCLLLKWSSWWSHCLLSQFSRQWSHYLSIIIVIICQLSRSSDWSSNYLFIVIVFRLMQLSVCYLSFDWRSYYMYLPIITYCNLHCWCHYPPCIISLYDNIVIITLLSNGLSYAASAFAFLVSIVAAFCCSQYPGGRFFIKFHETLPRQCMSLHET